jgi:hypothetical protein
MSNRELAKCFNASCAKFSPIYLPKDEWCVFVLHNEYFHYLHPICSTTTSQSFSSPSHPQPPNKAQSHCNSFGKSSFRVNKRDINNVVTITVGWCLACEALAHTKDDGDEDWARGSLPATRPNLVQLSMILPPPRATSWL